MISLASTTRVLVHVLLVVAATATAQTPTPASRPGVKVTYAPLDTTRKAEEGQWSYRARLMALDVERGETPTPMLSPGMFVATFEGVLPLIVRDRFRFQVEGRGSVQVSVNGAEVLSGTMRPGKPMATAEPVRLQKGDNRVVVRVESAAAGDAQVRLSWSGPEFAFEPVPPDAWRWAADDAEIAAGERLQRGHQLFVERRCAHCHQTQRPLAESAFGDLEQGAPDLRNVGSRLHPAFVVEWLRDPRAVRHDATMPRFRTENDQELADMAAWLATLGTPLAQPPFPGAAAKSGADVFLRLGCVACHLRPDEPGGAQPGDRTPLAFVGRKWVASALLQYLADPARDHPHTRMPNFKLDAADVTALAAYLLSGSQPAAPPRGDVEAGRRLVQRHGCDHCHQLPLPEAGRRIQGIESLHADHGCLAGDPKAPDPGLAAAEVAAVAAFLPHAVEATRRRAPLDYAARWMDSLRCTACHGRDGAASGWAAVAEAIANSASLAPEQDPRTQSIPSLTWVGGKLQPSWMERFVTGREPSPRPWLHARMPAFASHGPVITVGLARQHGYASTDEPAAAPDVQMAQHGARLVKMGEGFGCVQCHGVGDTPPVQVFERQGINFSVAAARLRHDYYLRWLLDPPRIDPDAKMPKFADPKGKTPLTETLGGDARAQFEAIWDWFRTLR